MKNRKKLKGFTLIELIIVMAIFGILMTAVLQVLTPLNKLSKRASIQEANAAAVDNIKNYFEGSLRYADCIEVCVGGLNDNNGNRIAGDNRDKAVENFVNNHYTNRTKEGTDEQFEGTVRVLQLFNNACNDPVLGNVKAGEVYEFVYSFTAGYTYTKEALTEGEPSTLERVAPVITESKNSGNSVINDTYYDNYAFYFIPGYNKIEVEGDTNDYEHYVGTVKGAETPDGATYPAFTKDMFSFSVVTYNNDTTVEGTAEKKFTAPYALSNLNMSLVNINSPFSEVRTNELYGPDRVQKKGESAPKTYTDNGHTKYREISVDDAPMISNRLFVHNTVTEDPNDCIYFIYTLPECK